MQSISPTSGPVTGGTSVTIRGFGFTGAESVLFGAVPATSFTVISSRIIVAVSPAQAAQRHDVRVTRASFVSPKITSDVFTYKN
jgi:hypothetical protein